MSNSYNYNKLKGKIKEKCGSQQQYAILLGLSSSSISGKLNNFISFSQDEISESIKILQLGLKEIGDYFFTTKVEDNSTKEG